MAEPWQTLGALRFVEQDGPRWIFEELEGPGRLILSLLEESVLRVQVQPAGQAFVPRTWAVTGKAGDVPAAGRDREDLSVFTCPAPVSAGMTAEGFQLCTDRFFVYLRPDKPGLTVTLPDGQPLLTDHHAQAWRHGPAGMRHTLSRDLQEIYLGLGEASGPLNRHNRRFRLRPADALGYDARDADPLYKHIPAYLTVTGSGHAAGLVYDSAAEAVFDFGHEVDNYQGYFRYAEFRSRELDYYVLVGPRVSDVVTGIQELTGFAPLPPRWSLPYQGSTMSYTDSADPTAALEGFVKRLEQENMTCGAFNLSSGYSMGDDGLRYVFAWNRKRVPEPKKMSAALSNAGIRTLANIKPALLTSHPEFAELAAADGFARQSGSGDPYLGSFWGGDGAHLDFSNPATYDWWVSRVRSEILEQGIDVTWNDNNEFQISDDEARLDAGRAGDLRPVMTLLMNMASRDAQRQHDPGARDYQLTRSGFLGMQRYAQTWSGDNYTSWRTLRYNLPMGLGMSLSGWANHGHDVGGFAGPMPDPELLLRWVEAGVFQPRFCIHSWNDDQTATEPWSHPEVLPEVRRLIAFRQALVPYLYTLMHESVTAGVPLTRPFVYAFQDWAAGRQESFAYLLGPALLVAPVMEPGQTVRRQLLPPGRWLELQTGLIHQGEAVAELWAEPGWPPLLLREGHAMPLAVEDSGVEWLAFPDNDGNYRGELIWDDGVSRVESLAEVSTVVLGPDSLSVTGAALPAGFDPQLGVRVPGGNSGSDWFRGNYWQERD